jgi:hypothetical protein
MVTRAVCGLRPDTARVAGFLIFEETGELFEPRDVYFRAQKMGCVVRLKRASAHQKKGFRPSVSCQSIVRPDIGKTGALPFIQGMGQRRG